MLEGDGRRQLVQTVLRLTASTGVIASAGLDAERSLPGRRIARHPERSRSMVEYVAECVVVAPPDVDRVRPGDGDAARPCIRQLGRQETGWSTSGEDWEFEGHSLGPGATKAIGDGDGMIRIGRLREVLAVKRVRSSGEE